MDGGQTAEYELLHHQPDDERDGLGVLRQYTVTETYRRHGHDFFELFLVLRGQALHDVNGSSLLLDAGSLVLIRPGDVHSYRLFNSFDFEFINVALSQAFFAEAMAWLELPQAALCAQPLPPHVRLMGHEELAARRHLLAFYAMAPGPERRRFFRTLLPELIAHLTRGEGEATGAVLPGWFAALLGELDRPEIYTTGLNAVLPRCNCSQEHLIRTFRRYLNMTPTDYINTKRLHLAAELLLTAELSPLAVCGRAGFGNLSHFYHLFKEQYGCPPGRFAAQYGAKQILDKPQPLL